jgi:hypothetical protein
MSGFDANDFQGGIQPGSPDGNAGGNPPTDPNAPAGAAPGGDGQQPPADREGWIPRNRFDEVNSQYQRTREDNARLQAQIQERENLARTMLGQPAQAQEDPFTTRVREQLLQVFPQLKMLVDLAPHLEKLPQVLPQHEAQQDAFYQQLGTQHMSALTSAAATLYGVEKLSDPQRSFLSQQFIGWLGNDQARQRRYMAGDTSVTADFMQEFQAVMLDPIRRSALTQQQNRAGLVGRLPSRGPATAPIPGSRPPQITNEEDRHEAAFNALIASQG